MQELEEEAEQQEQVPVQVQQVQVEPVGAEMVIVVQALLQAIREEMQQLILVVEEVDLPALQQVALVVQV